jgi:hypothetical protein
VLLLTPTVQNDLAVKKTGDNLAGVNVVNSLVAFCDIHVKERSAILMFCPVRLVFNYNYKRLIF